MGRSTLTFFVWAIVGAGVCAETNSAAKLRSTPPCAPLIAAARANNIPLEQIEDPTGTDRLDPGDSVSALITVFDEGKQRSQWLVYLEVALPDAKERASTNKPAPPMVLYSSFGSTQKCVSVPAFAMVRTLGPFVESAKRGKSAKVPEKTARFQLNEGFVGLGFHHAAAACRALEQGPIRGTWSVSHVPFGEADLAKGRELAARLKFTPDQDRGLVVAIPALLSYFEIVQHTPGLSDILYEIVDLPSAWSLVRNAGVKSIAIGFGKGVVETKPELWQLPETAPAYHFPLTVDMNGHRALNLTFVVTDPSPPLLACASVVGLLAEKPDDAGRYLTLRVLSARAGRPKT